MAAIRSATALHLRRSLGTSSTSLGSRGLRFVGSPLGTANGSSRILLGEGTIPYLSRHPLVPALRKFSTQVAETASKEQGKQQKKHGVWWYRFANFVRYVRIPALVLGVYSLGYQQGIMDCTKTPKMLQDKIMSTILVEQGVKDTKHVQVVGEMELRKFSSRNKEHFHVAQVGQKVIEAAKQHVQVKLSESMEKVREKLPDDMADHLLEEHYAKDADCEFWYHAGLRLMGENDNPWHYVFIQTSMPNAFVTGKYKRAFSVYHRKMVLICYRCPTEMLPQRFFITTGLLELADNPDGE